MPVICLLKYTPSRLGLLHSKTTSCFLCTGNTRTISINGLLLPTQLRPRRAARRFAIQVCTAFYSRNAVRWTTHILHITSSKITSWIRATSVQAAGLYYEKIYYTFGQVYIFLIETTIIHNLDCLCISRCFFLF